MAEPRELQAKAALEKHFATVDIRKAAGQWMYSLDPQGDRDAVASVLSAHLRPAFDGQDAHMLVFSPDNKILLPTSFLLFFSMVLFSSSVARLSSISILPSLFK